eukprot:5852352-Pyramimonas_sp.AAC.1
MTESGKPNGRARSPNLHPGPFTPTSPEAAVVHGPGLTGRVLGQAPERGGLPQQDGPGVLEGHGSARAKAASNRPQTKT